MSGEPEDLVASMLLRTGSDELSTSDYDNLMDAPGGPWATAQSPFPRSSDEEDDDGNDGTLTPDDDLSSECADEEDDAKAVSHATLDSNPSTESPAPSSSMSPEASAQIARAIQNSFRWLCSNRSRARNKLCKMITDMALRLSWQ